MSNADPPDAPIGETAPPIAARVLAVDAFLRLGRFRAATVQRSFRWSADEALKLLLDLDTLLRAWDPSENGDESVENGGDDDAEAGARPDPAPQTPFLPGFEIADAPPPLSDAPLDALFLGAVVLVRAQDGVFEIYDGLQRTTTLTILCAVLRDLESDRDLRHRLHGLIAYSLGDAFRLTFPERDETLPRDVQRQGATLRMPNRLTARRPVGKRLQRVKNALLAALRGWDPEQRRRLSAFLLERAHLAVIEVADPRLGRQIFVSTNLYGARLSPIETLKGQLIDCAATEAEEDEVVAIWTEVSELLGGDFERFLSAIDAIERCQIQQPQWPTDLGEQVRRRYADGAIVQWMRRLRRSAFSWRNLQTIWSQGGAEPIAQDLWRLSLLPWDDWRPLALFFWNRYYAARQAHGGGDPQVRTSEELEKWCERVVARLQRRCMALALADLSEARRRMIFTKALRTALAGRDPTVRGRDSLFPTPIQRRKVDRMLRGQIKDERLWGALTRWIEAAVWREGLPTLLRAATVEHVLPRNPPPDSPSQAVAVDSGDYDRLCYALGNLTMLSREANDLVANWAYPDKRPVFEEQASGFLTLQSVVAEKEWGADQIEARSEALRLLTWKLLDLEPPGP